MFVEEDELMTIIVHYKKIGRHYVAYNDEKFKMAELSDEAKEGFSTLTIKARQLTWGFYNDLQESAMVRDNLGDRHWNYKVYKENKLRKIIVKWDATMKDEEGNVKNVPVTPQIIAKMSPDIAEVIINTYDQMTLIDDDTEKKS